MNDSPSEWFRVGKIGRKCTNFIEYARKCVEQLELNIVVSKGLLLFRIEVWGGNLSPCIGVVRLFLCF